MRRPAAAHAGLDAAELLRANREAWAGWRAEVEADWTLGKLDGAAVTREAWRRTLAACGRDDPQLVAAACETHSSRLRGSLRLFPEVAGTLASLARDYALALVTNGASDTQRETLRRLGIEGSFRAFAISGELGVAATTPRPTSPGRTPRD